MKDLKFLEEIKEYLPDEKYESLRCDFLCEALANKFKEDYKTCLESALNKEDISSRLHKLLLLQDIIYTLENCSESIALNAIELKALLDNRYSWIHIDDFFSEYDNDRMYNVILAIESAGRKMAVKND